MPSTKKDRCAADGDVACVRVCVCARARKCKVSKSTTAPADVFTPVTVHISLAVLDIQFLVTHYMGVEWQTFLHVRR
jgi:hypothetical protein